MWGTVSFTNDCPLWCSVGSLSYLIRTFVPTTRRKISVNVSFMWHIWLLRARFSDKSVVVQSDTRKRELLQNTTKIEEIKKKLLTEIEPLQLAF